MKAIIWFLLVGGIALPCWLAVGRLVMPAPSFPNGDKANSPLILSAVGVYIGNYPLSVSVSRWPAAFVLLGAGMLAIGMFFLVPRQVQ
jgi:hypothetical protein